MSASVSRDSNVWEQSESKGEEDFYLCAERRYLPLSILDDAKFDKEVTSFAEGCGNPEMYQVGQRPVRPNQVSDNE
jgi:hypothetical protein